jgi:hypothetical protein
LDATNHVLRIPHSTPKFAEDDNLRNSCKAATSFFQKTLSNPSPASWKGPSVKFRRLQLPMGSVDRRKRIAPRAGNQRLAMTHQDLANHSLLNWGRCDVMPLLLFRRLVGIEGGRKRIQAQEPIVMDLFALDNDSQLESLDDWLAHEVELGDLMPPYPGCKFLDTQSWRDDDGCHSN